MQENQQTEFKRQWHDDNLKEICAFANAQGGTLYVGVEDDGSIVGLDDIDELYEKIPTRLRDILGIVAELNILEKEGKRYLEIRIAKSETPINLRGKYYLRSGSSKIELSGSSLNDFLLSKSGVKSWDEVIDDRASFDDLDSETILAYKRDAENSGRIKNVMSLSDRDLLQRLKLIEGDKITRAAIILFAKDPKKFILNVGFKIGKMSHQSARPITINDFESNLITMISDVPDVLYTKYLTKVFSFEGMKRKETGEYPEGAMREMILNALVHRDYSKTPDIQMRVYEDRVTLWNIGGIPYNVTLDDLKSNPNSYPRNKLIAEACYRAGYIERFGSGLTSIYEECKEAGLPEPVISENDNSIAITLYRDKYQEDILKKAGLSEREVRAIMYTKEQGRITNRGYQEINDVSKTTAMRDLQTLTDNGFLVLNGKGSATFYELS